MNNKQTFSNTFFLFVATLRVFHLPSTLLHFVCVSFVSNQLTNANTCIQMSNSKIRLFQQQRKTTQKQNNRRKQCARCGVCRNVTCSDGKQITHLTQSIT